MKSQCLKLVERIFRTLDSRRISIIDRWNKQIILAEDIGPEDARIRSVPWAKHGISLEERDIRKTTIEF